MRTVRYMKGDITTNATDISDLNFDYHLLFTDLNIKGEVFGIGVGDKGTTIAVSMRVGGDHKIKSITIKYCHPENALLLYLGRTNGNAFALVNPKKEDWFKRTLSCRECKAHDMLEEICDNYSGP